GACPRNATPSPRETTDSGSLREHPPQPRPTSMKLSEYASHDALGLADLVARREVSARELAETAARAIDAVNPAVNAVVETYPDRIEDLDERTLGDGPFR